MEPETETERDRECPKAEKQETRSADRKPERENRKKPSRRSADQKTKDKRDDQTVVHRPENQKTRVEEESFLIATCRAQGSDAFI